MIPYINIIKQAETDSYVDYAFAVGGQWKSETATGRVRIDKLTGSIVILDQPLDISISNSSCAQVIYKLTKHWESSQYPQETSWMS